MKTIEKIEKWLRDRGYSVTTEKSMSSNSYYIKTFNCLEVPKGVIRISDHKNQSRINPSNCYHNYSINDSFAKIKKAIKKSYPKILYIEGIEFDWNDQPIIPKWVTSNHLAQM
jgi:hypothetical protein